LFNNHARIRTDGAEVEVILYAQREAEHQRQE